MGEKDVGSKGHQTLLLSGDGAKNWHALEANSMKGGGGGSESESTMRSKRKGWKRWWGREIERYRGAYYSRHNKVIPRALEWNAEFWVLFLLKLAKWPWPSHLTSPNLQNR